MDLSMLITLLVIFGATLVASVLSSLKRDRCLVDFDDYMVVVERVSARPVYGSMSLSSTGFELVYETPALDDQLHQEGSYVFYSSEYVSISGVYRFVDELTADKRDERLRSWMRAFHGSFWTRLKRRVSNFIGTATDSLSNALNLVVGKTTARAQEEQLLLAQGETEIKGLTKQMLGYVGKKFDPLLEKLVGELVVLQVTRDSGIEEYVGILKDYSSDFIEILDCYVPEKVAVRVGVNGDVLRDMSVATPSTIGAGTSWLGGIEVALRQGSLYVTNLSDRPALLLSLSCDEQERDVTAMLDATKRIKLDMPSDVDYVTLQLCVMLRYDLIVPRRIALVRHRAEWFASDLVVGHPVIGLSTVYSPEEEDDLRLKLASQPDDAQLAQALAIVLIAHNESREAERWLKDALANRSQLADGGLYASLLCEYVHSEIERVAHFTEASCQKQFFAPVKE